MIAKAALLCVAAILAAGVWSLTVGFSLPHGFLTPTGPTPVIRPTITQEVAPTIPPSHGGKGHPSKSHGSLYHDLMIIHRITHP